MPFAAIWKDLEIIILSVLSQRKINIIFLLLSHSVVLDSLCSPWTAACQAFPSLSPRVCSNLCPLSQWQHPTISSSVAPFSSCPQYHITYMWNLPATEWNTNTAEWFKSLYFNTCFLQLLYFISLAQQPTGQAAKHYDSETIQCAGAGRDNLYLDLFTAAKTLFWGTSLST